MFANCNVLEIFSPKNISFYTIVFKNKKYNKKVTCTTALGECILYAYKFSQDVYFMNALWEDFRDFIFAKPWLDAFRNFANTVCFYGI